MAILEVKFMSKALMRTVAVNVYLPTDRFSMNEEIEVPLPYKTLYLLHGVMGSQDDWLLKTNILDLAAEANLAVIMPAGENQFYVDQPDGMTHFSQFIGQELVTMTRHMFPLSYKAEDTYIAGLSMGGYGALINGLANPQHFSVIGAFSSALIMDHAQVSRLDQAIPFKNRTYYQAIFGDIPSILNSYKNPTFTIDQALAKGQKLPKIFMTCGTEDTLMAANREFYQANKDKDLDITLHESEGGHEWPFWQKSIQAFIQELNL